MLSKCRYNAEARTPKAAAIARMVIPFGPRAAYKR